jgi:hypothetical protein
MPSYLILLNVIMEEMRSTETSVLTSAKRRHVQVYSIIIVPAVENSNHTNGNVI